MVRVDRPHEPRSGVELQAPTVMANPTAEVVGGEFDAVTAECDLPARRSLQRFTVLQAKLERQARVVGGTASTGVRKVKGQCRLGWLRYVKFAEESVVGEREPVLLLAHVQTTADGHVNYLPEQLFRKSSQLGLALGIGARDN